MADASAILINACSQDPQVRGPAEKMLNDYRDQDFPNFLRMLVTEFRDESKNSLARQMAGITLKNSVAFKARDETRKQALEDKWNAVDTNVRQDIKREILSTLGSPDPKVRGIVALVIANLARIEIPKNQWPDLIGMLTGVCKPESAQADQMVEAALTALGYICEECDTSDLLSASMATHSRIVLEAIFAALAREAEMVRYFAVNALCNSIEFISEHMDVDAERNYLFDQILAMCKAPHARTRERAMETLARIGSLYYDKLLSHMTQIYEVTTNAIRSDAENVGLQALQFWIAVGEMEVELKSDDPQKLLSLTATVKEPLFGILTECLVKQEEGQTDEDWNISIAAAKTLAQAAEVLEDAIVPIVVDWVYKNIAADHWRQREAAVTAFGCILHGPTPENLETTVRQSMAGLFTYIQSGHPMVRDSSAWVMSVIATEFDDILLEADNLRKLFEIVAPLLMDPDLSLAERAASVFHNLCLSYEEDDDLNTSELSPHYRNLAYGLLAVLDRPDMTATLRSVTQETLNALIQACPVDAYGTLKELLPNLVARIDALSAGRKQVTGSQATDIELAQGLYCGALNSICRKLGPDMTAVVQPVATALVGVFQSAEGLHGDDEVSVLEEAMMGVGSLACATKAAFVPYLGGFIPYVAKALGAVNEYDVCCAAIATIGDLVASVREQMLPHLSAIMNLLVSYLRSETVDSDLKGMMIGCIGDICLHIGEVFQPYLAGVMSVIGDMDKESRAINFNEEDTRVVVFGLWEAFCGMYTGVLQGFGDKLEIVMPYMMQIVTFVQFAGPIVAPLDPDCLKAIINLIGDVANVVMEAGAEIIRASKATLLDGTIMNIIISGQQSKDERVRKAAAWTIKELNDVKNFQ